MSDTAIESEACAQEGCVRMHTCSVFRPWKVCGSRRSQVSIRLELATAMPNARWRSLSPRLGQKEFTFCIQLFE